MNILKMFEHCSKLMRGFLHVYTFVAIPINKHQNMKITQVIRLNLSLNIIQGLH